MFLLVSFIGLRLLNYCWLLLVVVGYCVCETGVSVGFKLAEYTGFKHNRSHMSRLKKVDHYFSPLLVLGS